MKWRENVGKLLIAYDSSGLIDDCQGAEKYSPAALAYF